MDSFVQNLGIMSLILPIVISIIVVSVSAIFVVPLIIKSLPALGNIFSMFGSGAEKAKILNEGRSAKAKVLSLKNTGVRVNYQPMATIKLEVDDDGKIYIVEVQTIIDQLKIPQVQPGSIVPVKIDKNDPKKVVLNLI